MRAFRFGLVGVLSFRKMKEDAALREFVAVKRVADERREALDRLFRTRDLARHEMGEKGKGAVEPKEMLQYQRYLSGLSVQIASARTELAKIEKELEARRQILLTASTERKAIEKVRDRRHEAWNEEFRHEEQRETDEVGIALHYRNGGIEP